MNSPLRELAQVIYRDTRNFIYWLIGALYLMTVASMEIAAYAVAYAVVVLATFFAYLGAIVLAITLVGFIILGALDAFIPDFISDPEVGTGLFAHLPIDEWLMTLGAYLSPIIIPAIILFGLIGYWWSAALGKVIFTVMKWPFK